MMNNKNIRKTMSGSLLLGIVLLAFFTTSCSRYTNIPKSDWDSISWDAASQLEIKTSTTVYRVHRFVVTDSTIILEDASRVHKNNYPANSFEAIDSSELPIVLPFNEVLAVQCFERSRGRTVVFGVVVGTLVIGVGVVLIFAHSMEGFD